VNGGKDRLPSNYTRCAAEINGNADRCAAWLSCARSVDSRGRCSYFCSSGS